MGNLEPLARTYPAGVTSWVEVALTDVGAGKVFYGGLFGWRFDGLVATLDGLDVASVGDVESGPAAWATYVAVDDADAMAQAMVDLGAELVAPPEEAGEGGRAATVRDPQGAEIRLWQANLRLGAQLTNSPGAWNFSDLHTADPAAAARFYEAGFGWRVVDQGWGVAIQVPGYGDHLEATVDPDIRIAPGLRAGRFRGCHRWDRAGRGRRADALARHLHRGRPRHVGRACGDARRPGAGHR